MDVPDIVRSILAEDKQSYALDRHVKSLPWRTSLQLLKALLPHAQASLDHGASMPACICFHSKTFVDVALDCHDSEAQSEVEQLLRLDKMKSKKSFPDRRNASRVHRDKDCTVLKAHLGTMLTKFMVVDEDGGVDTDFIAEVIVPAMWTRKAEHPEVVKRLRVGNTVRARRYIRKMYYILYPDSKSPETRSSFGIATRSPDGPQCFGSG
jgi:hypothetical protein